MPIEYIHTTKDAVKAYYAAKGLDAVELAKGYVAQWAAKVPSGTQTLVAKMKCDLVDNSCGCPKGLVHYKCQGPYLPVALEILLEVLAEGVEGVETLVLPAPQAHVADGHVQVTEFAGPHSLLVNGPAQAMYVKKL